MKLNPSHSRTHGQFLGRLQLQRDLKRRDLETVDGLLVGAQPKSHSLFKSADQPSQGFRSVDELLLAGNQQFENLDNVDFAGFRNDKKLGAQVLQELRQELKKFHADEDSPGYRDDLRRLVNARYLQGHGLTLQAHLDGIELAQLRRYLQNQDSAMNLADAGRAINQALEAGEQDPARLILAAEQGLFSERGVAGPVFSAKFADISPAQLQNLREFSDSWAVSQSGQYLLSAQGNSPEEMRDSIARQLLASMGYQNCDHLDMTTVLSLLRDSHAEGPRTNRRLAETISQAAAHGENNYFVLNTLGNQAILEDIGISTRQQKALAVSDRDLLEAYPESPAAESRAERTRVLRDLLRVLPDGERALAIQYLQDKEANLIDAEQHLAKHLGQRIRKFSGYTSGYGQMGAMQRANLTSALSKLPESLRQEMFAGYDHRAKDVLEKHIETRFGIEIHREARKSPGGLESYAPFVHDFSLQGLADIYNGLNSMAIAGALPPGITGTTTLSHMVGAPTPLPLNPVHLREKPAFAAEPYQRPGAYSHSKGKSGFFGECSQNDKGHDQVVLYDDALYGPNSDSTVGVSLGEATVVHELGHAIQLGGTPNAPEPQRKLESATRLAEWSSLSQWTEPDHLLADGRMGSFEYYYDPTVQVQKRQEVATAYGASDPCEDFAEYTPFFFHDPATAIGLSREKFLYFNQLVGQRYSPSEIERWAGELGHSSQDIQRLTQEMQKKVAQAPQAAGIPQPN